MKVLVCGGAGYIGMAVSHVLHQSGYAVVRLDNLAQPGDTPEDLGALIPGDIRDTRLLEQVMRSHRITSVIQLAGKISVSESVAHPLTYWANNVTGTLSVIEAMTATGVRQLVFSSTAAVYGEPERLPLTEDHPIHPLNPYGHTKWAVEWILEDLARANVLSYAALRYFNAAGAIAGVPGERHQPEQHLIPNAIRAALGGRPLHVFGTDYPTSDGTAVRDYIHIQDLADAHVLALRHLDRGGGSGAFNLANRRGYSVREVIQAVERVTGMPVPYVEAPRRAGDPAQLIGDSSRARSVLHWQPRFEHLDQIVASAVAWHRQQAP